MRGGRRRSDEDLLLSAQQGHRAALGTLYDRYGSVAYGLALRILGDSSLAEAAVEDAFASLVRMGPAETESTRVRIVTLVHRSATDRRRREAPRTPTEPFRELEILGTPRGI